MSAIDGLNRDWGGGTIALAAAGIPRERRWGYCQLAVETCEKSSWSTGCALVALREDAAILGLQHMAKYVD